MSQDYCKQSIDLTCTCVLRILHYLSRSRYFQLRRVGFLLEPDQRLSAARPANRPSSARSRWRAADEITRHLIIQLNMVVENYSMRTQTLLLCCSSLRFLRTCLEIFLKKASKSGGMIGETFNNQSDRKGRITEITEEYRVKK